MACDAPLLEFLKKNGLDATKWRDCLHFVRVRNSQHFIRDDVEQGGCSYTFRLIPKDTGQHGATTSYDRAIIIQLRPLQYALSMDLVSQAKAWYGHIAPDVTEEGRFTGPDSSELIMYRMPYIQGKRFEDLRPRPQCLGPDLLCKHRNLLDDLANFYAVAWTRGLQLKHSDREPRMDGKVGSSIRSRLQKLEAELPSSALRSIARTARKGVEIGDLDQLPIVFTHGDLLPSNILVDEQTWRIHGLVDWAEAEFLPFGISLYGLDHLLDSMSSNEGGQRSFAYLDEAGTLRRFFWKQLIRQVPELDRRDIRDAAELARIVGILLWHGFAWDDGKIDRVVDPSRDVDQLAYLNAFLGSTLRDDYARL